jgi:hypothetical protein
MAAHPLAGRLSVDESARLCRHYRYAEERMMRMMGGWIALTPELPVKLLLGRHVWDCAQHADLWGKRLAELRAPAQVSEPSSAAFGEFVDVLESCDRPHQSVERVVGIYRVLKPHLLAAYETHLVWANPVYEPPTRRILERCLEEERRHIAAGRTVLTHLTRSPRDHERADAHHSRLAALLAESGGVTGAGGSLMAPEVSGDSAEARNLVMLGQPVDPWPFPPGLEAAIDSHTRRILQRDLVGIQADLMPACRSEGLEVYRSLLERTLGEPAIVALARVGAHRIVKISFGDTSELQLRWAQEDECWQIHEVELLRAGDGA